MQVFCVQFNDLDQKLIIDHFRLIGQEKKNNLFFFYRQNYDRSVRFAINDYFHFSIKLMSNFFIIFYYKKDFGTPSVCWK